MLLTGAGEIGAASRAAEAAGAAGRAADVTDAVGPAGRGLRGVSEAGEVAGATGAMGDVSRTTTGLTKDLEQLTTDLPKSSPPPGGRPLELPPPRPAEAPVGPTPHPIETSPTATAPRDLPAAAAPGAPERAAVPSPNEHPVPVAAANPQLAEPAPAQLPVSPGGYPAEPAPVATPTPQSAPAFTAPRPGASAPHAPPAPMRQFPTDGRPPEPPPDGPGPGAHSPESPPAHGPRQGGNPPEPPPHDGAPGGPGDGSDPHEAHPPGDDSPQGVPDSGRPEFTLDNPLDHMSPELRALSEQHLTSSGETVLGPFQPEGGGPSYIEVAQQHRASYFDIGTDAWNAASPTERLAANQHVLDMAIAKGDTITLSVPFDEIRPASFTAAEIRYLESHGYQRLDDFTFIPPNKGAR
jgi:hypothetical protein